MGSCSSSIIDEDVILSTKGLSKTDILDQWIERDKRQMSVNEHILRFLITGEDSKISRFTFNFENDEVYRDNSITYYKEQCDKYSEIIHLESRLKELLQD